MSDFEYQPAYGASVTRRPRVLASKFGDGYEQRTPDGINNDLRTWSFTVNAPLADIAAIDAFLADKAGVTSFTWTPSGENEIRVKCSEWSRTRIAPNVSSINLTLEEVPA